MLESVGLGLVCCPLFLLMKGEEGVIKAEQVFNVFTISSSKIKVVKKWDTYWLPSPLQLGLDDKLE